MSSGKKYFISGGGTGGHIYPAFTVAEKLLSREDTEKIYFVGNPENMECEIAKKYPEIEFLPVKISGMPRKIGFDIFKWFILFVSASLKTVEYMKKYEPDAVFTTGGYVSAPAVAAAKILNIPYMIHDCDSVPGITSKIAAPGAKIVSVAFETSKKVLKSKNIIFNGNPIRDAFFEVTKEEARKKLNIPVNRKVLYITGGSQGAKTINDATCDIVKNLLEELDLIVIWQTGKKKYDDTIKELEEIYPEYKNNPNLILQPYFEETVYPLKSADLVVARAGSLSLSEIVQSNAASVLIPYPYAAQDHQRKNAKEMCKKGLSLYLEDEDCKGENLFKKIKSLIHDDVKLLEMQENTKKESKSNPTEEIVKQLKSIIK